MTSPDNPQIGEKEDILNEMSEYFNVLGNETRLKMLKIIEKEPKDARMIARILHDKYNIEVAIPNAKSHLSKLIEIGVATKYPIIREDGQIVMNYRRVEGSLDAVLNYLRTLKEDKSKPRNQRTRDLKEIVNIIKIINEFPLKSMIALLNGQSIVNTYQMEKKNMRIGRIQPDENEISLPDIDQTVSRMQSRILYESGKYYIEDIGSKNGTYIMDSNQKQFVKLKKGEHIELRDEDIIRLGELNTILVFKKGRE